MAVGTFDAPVFAVDLQLGLLIAANLAAQPLSFGLRFGSMAGPLSAVMLNLPPPALVRHDPMRVSRHVLAPCLLKVCDQLGRILAAM